jgi:integrase/recombinase XerD
MEYEERPMGKRAAHPAISATGAAALAAYEQHLRTIDDLNPKTIRNYLSDLRQFIAWCEQTWNEGVERAFSFSPPALSTPLLTRYRATLQTEIGLQPSSINRALVSVKRYCAWCFAMGLIGRNPASVVKLVGSTPKAPRHLSDTEEEALVAAVTHGGTLRDRTIIVLMLHTGLRVGEVCALRRQEVRLGARSGALTILGKRNKYREVPLNATARAVLEEYLPTVAPTRAVLFPSEKTGEALHERAVGYLIARYATQANLVSVRPHDLRHRFGYRMAERVPIHRLAQIMGHDSLDTTMIYIKGTPRDLQREVEKIAWT